MIVAAASLGIRPDDFWALTPYEFYLYQRGRNESLRNQQRLLAWHAANVMQVHCKKKITPARLLGESKTITAMDPEERKHMLDGLKAKSLAQKQARDRRRRHKKPLDVE